MLVKAPPIMESMLHKFGQNLFLSKPRLLGAAWFTWVIFSTICRRTTTKETTSMRSQRFRVKGHPMIANCGKEDSKL
jgi:hypothetical protein